LRQAVFFCRFHPDQAAATPNSVSFSGHRFGVGLTSTWVNDAAALRSRKIDRGAAPERRANAALYCRAHGMIFHALFTLRWFSTFSRSGGLRRAAIGIIV
jgi:hypothetical protein